MSESESVSEAFAHADDRTRVRVRSHVFVRVRIQGVFNIHIQNLLKQFVYITLEKYPILSSVVAL